MPYFDHNATTPLHPAARAAWLRATDEAWHNPSSPYQASARAHRLLEEARERLAAILGTEPARIVFTSGATEANNAVLAWAAGNLPIRSTALVAATEHPSVLEPARHFFRERLRLIPVDRDGCIDLSALDAAASEPVGCVAVMAANNETGVIQPIDEVARHSRERGALLLGDGSQWLGKMPARLLPAAAFLIGGAHKFGGPKGVGFVVLPAGAEGFHAIHGGEQEHGHRAGTENLPAIAAMVAALEAAEAHPDADRAERTRWRDTWAGGVLRAIPGARINGGAAPRLWNTVSLTLPAHENTRWVARLDRLGFEVSTGSACATGSAAPSHVLAAMGLTAEQARRTIRISSGWETSEADWMALARALEETWVALETDHGTGGDVIHV